MQKLSGLIAAPFTAFDSTGELNLPAIEKQAEFLVENGVNGALVGGTTGECGSLTIEERLTITERWCEIAKDIENFPIIAHAGHSCLKESQIMAEQAEKVGASAVATLAPYYFKPDSVELLVEHCREIASAAPGLPFYYYHMPSMTGVFFPVIELLRAIGDKIPNFAGVKFTYEDMYDFGISLEFSGRKYDILCGRDESLLAGLALGAIGAVGSTYNYMNPIYLEVVKHYKNGDMPAAQAAQEKVRGVIDLLPKFGGLSAGKAMMKMVGIDCGDVRLPLERISDEKYQEFQKALEDVGFFEFCSKANKSASQIADV